ncbi:hypothetical protein CANMA_001606 [Candida margitis]|uniref:uncharacterized protein n=1 Tax=Candida margitis TaxID=1775924 RepID=UPI002227014C|nr:uncharacterized protein CANMA_001606 [Candida margitis]KAI5969358.1 hypothetical protein CANMA_001606 [Candida margitis]
MLRYRREARNPRAALLGSFESFFEENASFDEYIRDRYNRNPFTDDAIIARRKRRSVRIADFLKRSIQRVFQIRLRHQRNQVIYPVIMNAADIPNYETVVPARHLTTSMVVHPRLKQLANEFRGGIKKRQRNEVNLLSSAASAMSSVNSLFEDDRVSLEGTGATTADSNIPMDLI